MIGIFSLSLHPDHGGNDRRYAPMDNNYVAVAERVMWEFERVGVDAIIGLTHLHMWQDMELARLRARHPSFVLIAGGHEHEPEFSPLSAQSAAVVKGASNAREIWSVDVDFDIGGVPHVTTNKVLLDEQVQSDPDYDRLAGRWRQRLLQSFPFLEARIGRAAVPLDGREVTVRNDESNWASFIADQMRGAFGTPNADLAFINGGTLRIDDVIQGDIHFEDIGRTFGFSSYLRRTTVSGEEFRRILEAGYRGFGPSKGYFPQVSGFRVCVDRRRNEGDRIVSLQVPAEQGWVAISADKQYSLVVPDYLFAGGDGYRIPKDRPASRPASELIYRVLDAVLDAQAKGQAVGQPIDANNRRYFERREGKQPCFK